MRRASLILPVLLCAATTSAANLEIHYINVGWGSAVFLRGPDGTTVLLEAGNTGKGTAEVVPYLTSLGVLPADGLDYMIGGHQHCDHIGGLDEVIAAGYDVHVKQYFNGSATSSSCVTGWNAAAAGTTAGVPVVLPVGTVIQLGDGARATCVVSNGDVIGGEHVSVSDENDRSIGFLIQYRGFDYLWASDLGGGDADEACTGRSTSQVDVESAVITAISPGGAWPLISAGGIDVVNVNHHGSESSTNPNWMNTTRPAIAIIPVGAGQSGFELPRIDVVEHVLHAEVGCITVPAAIVLQTEEGAPIGPQTSTAGYSVGDIVIRTDGVLFEVAANGAVNQGPNEVELAALPITQTTDDPSGFPPPGSTLATATDTSQVSLTWTPVDGANHYEVFSSSNNTPFVLAGSPAGPPFVDLGRSSGTTYLYKIRAVSSMGGYSNFSNVDLATTVEFSDDPLQPGFTTVQAAHMLELRDAVNAVRAAAGLAPSSFTDVVLGGVALKASHLLELRAALDAARSSIGVPGIVYTNMITVGTLVRAVDLSELRIGVK